MTGQFTLRTATSDDVEIVLRHRQSMFAAMGRPASDASMQASRQFFTLAFARGRYHGWFVEAPGHGVVAGGGVVLLDYQPAPNQSTAIRPFVVNVWTEDAFRRRGLARQLMEAMIAWSRQQGFPSLFLHASNAGRPLYEALGFQATNEMRLPLL